MTVAENVNFDKTINDYFYVIGSIQFCYEYVTGNLSKCDQI